MPSTTPVRHLAAACLACALALFPAAAQATVSQADIDQSVDDGAAYLASQQTTSGAYPIGFGFDIVPTAMAAAGRNAADQSNGGATSQAAVAAALATLPDPDPADNQTTGDVQQGILTGYSAGIDPARVSAGTNVVAQLASAYDDGRFGNRASFTNTAYGVLALNRTRVPRFVIDRAVAAIRANQHNDGGWSFFESVTPADQATDGNTDTTSSTLAGLCLAGVGVDDPAVSAGLDFLERQLDKSTGAFDPHDGFGTPANADTNGVAISALNACDVNPQGARFTGPTAKTPVDYLVGLQQGNGSFPGFAPVYATQDAVRALAGEAFSANPPVRANPGNPRTRPVPAVADGTAVPLALAVDDGAGRVTFCRVRVASGAPLAQLLVNAGSSSQPAGCATGAEFTGGQLSRLNGQTGTWALSIDRGSEQIAAGQAVRFGDVVALRRTSGARPADAPAGPAIPAVVQAKTTPAQVASKSLKVSGRRRVVSVAVSCARENRLCQGAVYLVYAKRTLARRAFLIGGGKTTRLHVKLSKRALARVGRSRRIRVNLYSRDGNGAASTSTRTVTLRVGR